MMQSNKRAFEDANEIISQLEKLPDEAREKVCYIIQGAALLAESRTDKQNEKAGA